MNLVNSVNIAPKFPMKNYFSKEAHRKNDIFLDNDKNIPLSDIHYPTIAAFSPRRTPNATDRMLFRRPIGAGPTI